MLVADICRRAFRETILLSETEFPTPTQANEILKLYNELLASLYGTTVGERLQDWPLGNFGRDDPQVMNLPDPFVLARPWLNSRLIALNIGAFTSYLDPNPQDGARYGILDPYGRLEANPVTVDGNGRPIEANPTFVANTANLSREWMYRADLGQWVKLSLLLATDTHPFPATFDEMFRIMLAMRVSPRFGATIDATTQSIVQGSYRDFKARYIQSQPLWLDDSISWPFLSKQGYDSQQGSFTSNQGFGTGRPFGG